MRRVTRAGVLAVLVVGLIIASGMSSPIKRAQANPALRYWATVDNPFPFPGPGRSVTVTGYFTVDGLPAKGIHMATVWRNGHAIGFCYGVTGIDGTANCSKKLSTPLILIGMSVEISVSFTFQGKQYTTATGVLPV